MAKPEGKWPFTVPRRRWEGNSKIHLKEMESEIVGWINLAQASDMIL